MLCIAVLHHISSPARRLRLLAQLRDALRRGGRALVTVWAAEQEDPKKTLAKWHRIEVPAAAAGGAPGLQPDAAVSSIAPSRGGESLAASSEQASAGVAALSLAEASTSADEGAAASASGDYFVPWNVPFHRAESHRAMANAAASAGNDAAAASAGPGGGQGSAPVVNNAKGTVVFQRYYHVFAQGELDALVQQLPGVALVDSFYDHSNWCVAFERTVT